MAGVKVKECFKCPNSKRPTPCDYLVDIRKAMYGVLAGIDFEHRCPVYAAIFKAGDLVNIGALNLQGVVVGYFTPYYYVYTHRAFRGMNKRFVYTVKCSANDLQLLKARQADSQQILFNLIREYELEHKMEETDIFHQINQTIKNDIELTKKKTTAQLQRYVERERVEDEVDEQHLQQEFAQAFKSSVNSANRIIRIKKRLSQFGDIGDK